jgi:uncharacterized membrane protein YhaH (DUF805 family)
MTTPAERLDQPLYGASMGQAISRFYRNYAVFSGRASRSEYWWAVLFFTIVYAVLYALTLVVGFTVGQSGSAASVIVAGVFGSLFAIAFLGSVVPSLAIQWRRLHDAGYSGGFYFLSLIPWVGGIIVLILAAMPSNPSGVRFDRGYGYGYGYVSGPAVPPTVPGQAPPPSPSDRR